MSDPEESSSFSDEDDSYDESENLEFIQQPAEEQPNPGSRLYDIDLSARHTYMGSLLAANPGSTLFEANEEVDLFVIDGVEDVPMPGQIIPFNIYDSIRLSVIRKLIAKGLKTFGIVYRPRKKDLKFFHFPKDHKILGLTADIIEMTNDVGVSLKAVINQRFTSAEIRRDSDGNAMCTARILPDVSLLEIKEEIRPNSLRKFIKLPKESQNENKRRLINFSVFTPWPAFVFEMYDKERLLREARDEVASRASHSGTNIPKDPYSMSYWIGTNFPKRIDKLNILSLSCDVQRLRYGLSLFKETKNQSYECSVCGSEVFKSESMFTMSIEGPQSTYVNPGGCMFEVVTVYSQTAMLPEGPPSSEATWFPGYEWIIGRCSRCGRHLGWLYRAIDPGLMPQEFCAVMRRSVVPAVLSRSLTVPVV